MYKTFLDDITVLDLTTRLPGPLCTFILNQFGAKITKLENADKGGDAFNDEKYLAHAPHFLDWYQQINQNKSIFNFSFEEKREDLIEYIKSSKIIIMPGINYFDQVIKECNLKDKVIIRLAGGKNEWRSLHDLNALALTKTFKYHLKNESSPPYLPFAGINFASFLATASIATLRAVEKSQKSITQTFYLKDITSLIFDTLESHLVSTPGKFLHNGAFPCYQIYQSQDQKFVCLAAIEEKYWNNLNSCFNLELSLEDRFDSSGKVQEILKKMFAKLSSGEINKLTKDKQLCLSICDSD